MIIIDNINLISKVFHLNINKSIECCLFSNKLKLADISTVFKTGDENEKSNYRAVSILPAISKIHKRLLFYQINQYFDLKLSKYQCGFRKVFSTQYCLLLMLEKWERYIDKGGAAGVLLTDINKRLKEFIIAKVETYSFGLNALKLIHSYLTTRFQKFWKIRNIAYGQKLLVVFPKGLY